MNPSYFEFNQVTGRYELEGRELHCGDCFEIFVHGKWQGSRIEHGPDGWVLLNVNGLRWHQDFSCQARLYRD